MKIQNIRLGHATNSSSSHSIVLNSKRPENENHGLAFGWENFHLTTQRSKMCYLAATLASELIPKLGTETTRIIIQDLFQGSVFIPDNLDDMSVDHQSLISVPFKKDSNSWHSTFEPDYEFIKELSRYLCRSDISIFGGNDNIDPNEKEPVDGIPSPLNDLRDIAQLYSIKNDDWWILYNPHSGARITFSFQDNPKPLENVKHPLLVDLKITNYCSNYCNFCYQDSTRNGQHADLATIKSIIWDLARTNVLEVALGGGEPTKHPDFEKIVKELFDCKIQANFSTNSVEWITKPEKEKAVRNYVTAIGARPNVYEPIKKIFPGFDVCMHLIPGIDDVESIFKKPDYQAKVLLLGYKSTGRGKKVKPQPYSVEKILKLVKKNNITLSIDTKFAQMHQKELQENIPEAKILMAPKEGTFSMYIDAVTSQIGPDSYSGDLIKVNTNNYEEAIKNNFPFIRTTK